MANPKITLTIIGLAIASFTFQACTSKPSDKSGIETSTGQEDYGNASGSDTSHTTNNRRTEISGVEPKQDAKPANGSTTAQGMTGADSNYQKNSMKPHQ